MPFVQIAVYYVHVSLLIESTEISGTKPAVLNGPRSFSRQALILYGNGLAAYNQSRIRGKSRGLPESNVRLP
jgi:hypothetical protein